MHKKKYKNNHGFSLAETLMAVMILSLVAGLMASSMPTIINVYNRVTVGANAKIVLSTTISALRNELGTAKYIVLSKAEETAGAGGAGSSGGTIDGSGGTTDGSGGTSSSEKKYNVITYYSMDTQATSKIYLGRPQVKSGKETTIDSFDRDSIILQEYAYKDSDIISMGTDISKIKNGALPRQLIPTTAATENLYVTYDSIEVNDGGDIVVFNNIRVLKRDERAADGKGDREYMQLKKLNVRVAFGPVTTKDS